MIGSLMSRMGTAENLSIPQLKQAIQDGTLPAYVGIPLLQEKIKQQQPSGNVTTQPPIAEQVMQQASGVEQLPSNLPTEMAADGGIMHFASGDLVPDDEEDQADEDEYQQYLQAINPQGMGEYSLGPAIMAASQYKNIGAQPSDTSSPVESKVNVPKDKHGFLESIYNQSYEQAKKLGAKHPEVVAKIAASQSAIETGYGKSLAGGTNYFGIKGGKNPQNTIEYVNGKPIQTVDSFRKYGSQSDSIADHMSLIKRLYPNTFNADNIKEASMGLVSGKNKYATDPNYSSKVLSLASSYDKGGIASIPRFDGNEGSVVEEKYTPEELAKLDEFKQSNSGIGSFFRDTLPNYLYGKTIPGMGANAVNYIRNNADFSGVRNPFTESVADQAKAFRSYSAMDKNKDVTGQPTIGAPSTQQSHTTDFYDMIGPQGDVNAHDPMNRKTWVDDTVYKKPNAATPETTSATTSSTKSTPTNNATSESTGISALPSNQDQSADYFSLLKQNMADTAKEKENDKYMALLAAGLGMMSGTSPYAAANIGQGALAGVKQASEDQKLRAQQQAQYLKDYGTGVRYQQANETARQNALMNAKYNADRLGISLKEFEARYGPSGLEERQLAQNAQDKKEKDIFGYNNIIRQNEESLRKSITSKYSKSPDFQLNPQKYDAIIQDEINKELSNPKYAAWYEKAGLTQPTVKNDWSGWSGGKK